MSIDKPYTDKMVSITKEHMQKMWEKGRKRHEQINEAIHKIRNGRSLLDVALDVHMTKTGSYERSEQAQKDDVAVLIHVLTFWEPTVHKDHMEFDDAVKNLLMIAVNESALNYYVFNETGVICIDKKVLQDMNSWCCGGEGEENEKE